LGGKEDALTTRQALSLGLAVLSAVLLLVERASGSRGPSTSEERAKALELVGLLETAPSAPEAKEARKWLITWLAEIPDIAVTVCLDPLGSAEDREVIPAELTVHQAFAQAAFLIRNPDARGDSVEAYLAGVEGTLRAYNAMRSAGTVEVLPALEELKERQAAGDLEKVVRKRVKKCK